MDSGLKCLGGNDAKDKIERSIDELYAHDPERADAAVFGRKTGLDRRGFLGGAASPRWARRSAAPFRSLPTCRAG